MKRRGISPSLRSDAEGLPLFLPTDGPNPTLPKPSHGDYTVSGFHRVRFRRLSPRPSVLSRSQKERKPSSKRSGIFPVSHAPIRT